MLQNAKKYSTDGRTRRILLFNLFLFFILPLVTCPLWGQVVQKKQLTPADYHLWGDVTLDKVSPNEKWASYKMNYNNETDTLFVRNSITQKTYFFPSGDNSLFTKDNIFICQTSDNLHILNLETGRQENLNGVDQYIYSETTDLMITLSSSKQDIQNLTIKTVTGKIITEIPDVTAISISPNGLKLIYSSLINAKSSLHLIDLKKSHITKWLSIGSNYSFDSFVWQKKAKSLAFFGRNADKSIHSLFYFTLQNEKLYELNSKSFNFPDTIEIVSNSNSILVSDDAQKVFFTIKNKPIHKTSQIESKVEIWNANDPFVYAVDDGGKLEDQKRACLWKPLMNRFEEISTNKLPKMILSGNQQYAILSNPKDYEPQFEIDDPRDFYIVNLATMEKSIFLKKQSAYYSYILPSPAGIYIAYYRENNWWTYNILTKTHSNITANIPSKFYGKVNLLQSDVAYGNPGWSLNDKEILLYDQYDIWAVMPDGSSSRRLTKGRESKIRFRMAENPKLFYSSVVDGHPSFAFNLKKTFILKAEAEDGKTGYYTWNEQSGETNIIFNDSYTEQLTCSSKKQKLFYTEQKFNLPPRIMLKENSSQAKVFFQSNPQHNNYNWGRAELVHFKNSKLQDLNGVLFYPSLYDPQKKYPMIVSIYELQSHELHKYCNPTLLNESGFNPTVMTTEGYFFFLPDIIHENENVGPSALDCVESGTQKILDSRLVDPKRIGLMGHSFGGYETAFISNHSKLFKTAIASGAITDLTSFYLTFGWNMHKPDMGRFQDEQWRMMGKTPMENPVDFARNSPLSSVSKLQIPLLMWSGREDYHVDWHQSLEYYLALRRLGKKSILLLYPEEGHTIANPTNQKDLSRRVIQWFDYYLKDDKSAKWISNGVL